MVGLSLFQSAQLVSASSREFSRSESQSSLLRVYTWGGREPEETGLAEMGNTLQRHFPNDYFLKLGPTSCSVLIHYWGNSFNKISALGQAVPSAVTNSWDTPSKGGRIWAHGLRVSDPGWQPVQQSIMAEVCGQGKSHLPCDSQEAKAMRSSGKYVAPRTAPSNLLPSSRPNILISTPPNNAIRLG